jgi:hypothetical protein
MVNNFIGQFGEDYEAFDAIFVKEKTPRILLTTYIMQLRRSRFN